MADTCDAGGAEEVVCSSSLLDCCWLQSNPNFGKLLLQCAQYNGMYTPPEQLHWLLVIAFATMALMSFGIGANDAANSWGARPLLPGCLGHACCVCSRPAGS
jgi:hypothetical protein